MIIEEERGKGEEKRRRETKKGSFEEDVMGLGRVRGETVVEMIRTYCVIYEIIKE